MKALYLLLFLTTFTVCSQAAPAHSSKVVSSADILKLSQELIGQKRWEDAKKQLGALNKRRKGVSRLERAELNFNYGLCLEKLGKTDDALKTYISLIAVYGSYVTWSSQALERGFNLSYQKTELEKKINAYKYLRKILYMFQKFQETDDPSGALSRIRKRLPEVAKELKLTTEQQRDIDISLGIIEE
ncbi:MAG: hypothetical protein QM496_08105 [Verrucomicrobiota bacterium]